MVVADQVDHEDMAMSAINLDGEASGLSVSSIAVAPLADVSPQRDLRRDRRLAMGWDGQS